MENGHGHHVLLVMRLLDSALNPIIRMLVGSVVLSCHIGKIIEFCLVYGYAASRSKLFFESGFDDYMNMIMSNIICRPSCYKKQEAIDIIGGLFWELRNFNNRTFVTIPQATSTIMLDQYTTGSTDPQYWDLSPFKKWTFKDGNRHV